MPHALAIFFELVYAGYIYLKIGLAGQYVITGQIGARFCHALSLMPGGEIYVLRYSFTHRVLQTATK